MRYLLPLFLLLASLSLPAQSLSFSRDVQPVLQRKCVACHACYDAPCQLKMEAVEGLQRGASQQEVYKGTRRQMQQTTRLFVDGQSEADWRALGFASVLAGGDRALLSRMIELARQHPLQPGAPLPREVQLGIRRENQCPLPHEFARYAERNPHGGMPFAVSGLDEDEYRILRQWLDAGAPLEFATPRISVSEAAQIADWESVLNAPDARSRLVARWLYEHLFLAHLHFDAGRSGQFFELVRSRTPAPQPIELIATRRPNDDPGGSLYYRLRPLRGLVVHKTHITYALSAQKLARLRELFFSGDWQAGELPGYGDLQQANPFATFAAIPPQARYQFMLDDAEYFVRTFIRGPVCRGQIATDVIRDHFWTLFQAPEQDLFITSARYRARVTPLLELPGQQDELADLPLLWPAYRARHNEYLQQRRAAYAAAPRPDWSHLWQGNDQALLTIFRQHDSASVHQGLIGSVPQTLWWMDFPLLERTYYALVVNFDVFGNLSHQAQTRLYFDLIRNGAEQNFLRLMPAAARADLMRDWYQGTGRLRLWLDYEEIDQRTPSALPLSLTDPKRAFAGLLLTRLDAINARPDYLNRCLAEQCFRPGLSPQRRAVDLQLARLAARPQVQLPVIDWLPEASIVRVLFADGSRELYSLLRNRAHSNVAFMLGESLRYRPERDTLTLYPEILSSYPNFIFEVAEREVIAFVSALERAVSREDWLAIVARWGIRRSDPRIWTAFHDLEAFMVGQNPVEAGMLDLNRYEDPR